MSTHVEPQTEADIVDIFPDGDLPEELWDAIFESGPTPRLPGAKNYDVDSVPEMPVDYSVTNSPLIHLQAPPTEEPVDEEEYGYPIDDGGNPCES